MKNLKLITIAISLILITGCGFKIIDKRELLNFNIKEISTSGDKRINFELKNKLSDYNDTNSSKVIKIELDTKKTKSIKEKNISNEITKYQIKVIVNVKLIKTDNTNNLEFTIEREGDYVVADKFSQTLNNEKRRLEFIRQTLTEMLTTNSINNSNEISESELKGRAAFSDNLLRKLEVSKNREAHVLEEIKDNLNEVSKIEKQKEKIIKRKE